MKTFSSLVALALVFGTPVAQAANPALSLVGEPTVLVLNNPSCDEIIYTYHIFVATHDQNLRLANATLEVVDATGQHVVQAGTSTASEVTAASSFATNPVAITIPCAPQVRYEIYGDRFEVPAYGTEDFTVKLFFTPTQAGSYHALFTGLYFDTYAMSGSGICMNCVKVTNDDPVPTDFDETLTNALNTMNADEVEIVQTFLELLRSLNVIA